MVIGDVTLWEKTGGRSGTYRRGPLDDDLDLGSDDLRLGSGERSACKSLHFWWRSAYGFVVQP